MDGPKSAWLAWIGSNNPNKPHNKVITNQLKNRFLADFHQNTSIMVSLDLLSSFDGMIWLQSGKKVGALFEQHQTTISRNQKKCAQVFGIKLQKISSYWEPQEDSQLLQLERFVHQVARFQGKSSLRLDVNRWLDSSIFNPPPPWLAYRFGKLSQQSP